MRKLRKAAAVVTMVGGFGMAAAGVASAHGGGSPWVPTVTVTCTQDFGDTTATTADVTGAVTLTGPLVRGGDASSTANQPICGIGNQGGNVTSGDATGGEASVIGALA